MKRFMSRFCVNTNSKQQTVRDHFPFFFLSFLPPAPSSSPRRAASIFSRRAPSPVRKSVNFWNS